MIDELFIPTGGNNHYQVRAELQPRQGRVWCEVLRSDFKSVKKVLVPVPPTFYLTVYRDGRGEVARSKYRPRKSVKPGPLPDDVVTRLVRKALVGVA